MSLANFTTEVKLYSHNLCTKMVSEWMMMRLMTRAQILRFWFWHPGAFLQAPSRVLVFVFVCSYEMWFAILLFFKISEIRACPFSPRNISVLSGQSCQKIFPDCTKTKFFTGTKFRKEKCTKNCTESGASTLKTTLNFKIDWIFYRKILVFQC